MKDFAWTPGKHDGGYEQYPPYVNLTGNDLIVRGSEFTGEDGHLRMGVTAHVRLPSKVAADFAAALASAPQEPETRPPLTEEQIEARAQHAREAIERNRLRSAGAAPQEPDEDETYEIGKRDGYELAVQDIDLLTGGDGEYVASTILERDCRDAETMKARIVERMRPPIELVETALAVCHGAIDECRADKLVMVDGDRLQKLNDALTAIEDQTEGEEPDDDARETALREAADWLRTNIGSIGNTNVYGATNAMLNELGVEESLTDAFANRLQATPYCGIVVMPGDEAPETGEE